MNISKNLSVVVGAAALLSFVLAGNADATTVAEDNVHQQERGAKAGRPNAHVPVYRPPLRGAPRVLVGGGTRGSESTLQDIQVLAPEHTGLTTQLQPTLHWYTSKPSATRFEFVLINDMGIDPLLEIALPSTAQHGGIHTLRLADHGAKLSPGLEYQWSVSMVPDQMHRSRDVVASGRIKLVETSKSFSEELVGARPEELPFVYARASIWYDALGAACLLVEQNPSNPTFRRYRAALLDQIGLSAIAELDRQKVN